MDVIVTGAAGFIGFHTAKTLLEQGHRVYGIDNLNPYYDPKYKKIRLDVLNEFSQFSFSPIDITDELALTEIWKKFDPSHIVHLAAQAGVRYSIEQPMAYIQSNIVGFQRIIDLVRATKPTNFVYASSSSVYGGNKVLPFSESQAVENPISLYAASKLSNELVAKTYCHLFGIPATGLRFFTVYGPYGRPDMALFKFSKRILEGEPIPVFNHGKMIRDFTYIDDIVSGILASLAKPEASQVYNLGRGKEELLSDMIAILEETLGKKAQLELLPMQPGDVERTLADTTKAKTNLGYDPKVTIQEGIPSFVDWFRKVHSLK